MFTSQVVISQLHEAVERCRHGRHHPDCMCGNFRHGQEFFCTSEEWTYHRMIDRLLNQVCQRRVESGLTPVATCIPDLEAS